MDKRVRSRSSPLKFIKKSKVSDDKGVGWNASKSKVSDDKVFGWNASKSEVSDDKGVIWLSIDRPTKFLTNDMQRFPSMQ